MTRPGSAIENPASKYDPFMNHQTDHWHCQFLWVAHASPFDQLKIRSVYDV